MPVVKATSDFTYEACRFLISFPPPGTGKNNHLMLGVVAENTIDSMVRMPALHADSISNI